MIHYELFIPITSDFCIFTLYYHVKNILNFSNCFISFFNLGTYQLLATDCGLRLSEQYIPRKKEKLHESLLFFY